VDLLILSVAWVFMSGPPQVGRIGLGLGGGGESVSEGPLFFEQVEYPEQTREERFLYGLRKVCDW